MGFAIGIIIGFLLCLIIWVCNIKELEQDNIHPLVKAQKPQNDAYDGTDPKWRFISAPRFDIFGKDSVYYAIDAGGMFMTPVRKKPEGLHGYIMNSHQYIIPCFNASDTKMREWFEKEIVEKYYS